jgi:hypothetical protein
MHTKPALPVPTISQAAFFALPEVKRLQETQKRNPPSSEAWQAAEDAMILLTAQYNAAHFFL